MTAHASANRARFGGRLFVLLPVVILGLIGLVLFARTHRGKERPPSDAPQAHAFYYWKTQWRGSAAIGKSLSENGISRLYMRFFDVDWDDAVHGGMPVSPLQIEGPLPPGIEIIPVVFLRNRVFINTPYAQVDALADHVLRKIAKMAESSGVNLREVQLDCDWSDRSRASYFHFLDRARGQLHGRKLQLSATIRLHQIKYAARTGIPPVDRGMLMFYNFGQLAADAPRSSIWNAEDAQRYASYVAAYALPLDLSLPIFSWTVHSRDGAVLGLIEKLESRDIEATQAFQTVQPGRYQAQRGLFLRGRYFMEGDELRLEETTPEVTRQAAVIAAQGAAAKRYGTIAFFDLDERTLRHYATTDLQNIFALLR